MPNEIQSNDRNNLLNAAIEGQPLATALNIPLDLTTLRTRWFDTSISTLETYCFEQGCLAEDVDKVLALVRSRVPNCACETFDEFLVWCRQQIEQVAKAFLLFAELFEYEDVVRRGVMDGLIGLPANFSKREATDECVQEAFTTIFRQLLDGSFEQHSEGQTKKWLRQQGKFAGGHYKQRYFRRLKSFTEALAEDEGHVLRMGSNHISGYALNPTDAGRGLAPDFTERGENGSE